MSKAQETHLKDKLKTIVKERGQSINDLMMIVFLERFLARVARSSFSENLIFKGGFCLAKHLGIDRATKDLDFLVTKIDASQSNVQKMISEICAIDGNDGISYLNLNITVLDHHHMKYPGHRIEFQSQLGQIRFPMQIDLGVGDSVEPELFTVQLLSGLKGPIYEDSVLQLLSYPLETIFAEKYETAIKRASLNSRFKDYFDLVSLVESGRLGSSKFKKSFQATFKSRGTDPLQRIQTVLTTESIARMDRQWRAYLTKLPKHLQTTRTFAEAVILIDEFVIREMG